MGWRPSHLLHHLQSQGEYKCLCVTWGSPSRTQGSSGNLSHLHQRPAAQAPGPALGTSACAVLLPFSKLLRAVALFLWPGSKATSKCPAWYWLFGMNFSKKPCQAVALPCAHNFILWCSFSPCLSEISSVGFFKETLKFSIYF